MLVEAPSLITISWLLESVGYWNQLVIGISWLLESVGYWNQLVITISWCLESVCLCLKVFPLSGFHCIAKNSIANMALQIWHCKYGIANMAFQSHCNAIFPSYQKNDRFFIWIKNKYSYLRIFSFVLVFVDSGFFVFPQIGKVDILGPGLEATPEKHFCVVRFGVVVLTQFCYQV
jgi:hypothetical protein